MPLLRGQPDFAETAPAIQIQQLQESSGNWRRIFTGVMALTVVLIWATFIEHTTHERQAALEAAAQRDANLASSFGLYAARVFRAARGMHQLLGEIYRGGDASLLQRRLRDRMGADDNYRELAICTSDQRIVSSGGAATLLTPADCLRLRQETHSTMEVTMGPGLVAGGSLLLPLTLPVSESGDRGEDVAVALVPAQMLLGMMASTQLRDATTVLLVADDGAVRAAWRSGTGAVTDPKEAQSLAFLADTAAASDHAPVLDGEEQLVSLRELPEWGLKVMVASSRNDALSSFHSRRLFYLVVCGVMTAILLAVYLVLAGLQTESTARAKSLSRARTRLQLLNQQLDAQVRQRTAQLEQAYTDLETFSYTIAHDVRAPLAAIGTFAGELEAVVAASGSDKHMRYLARIQANAVQMDTLTQHLLELGKLTRAPLRLTRVDLSAMAVEVLERLRDAEPERAVELHVQEGLAARGDEALLRQVLENLLGNAWKFTGGRNPAHITFGRLDDAPAEGWQSFFVSDNGAGFDSDEAGGLYQPFQRLHSASEFPGSGVGLATVQRILSLHDGRVWSQSRPDEGATFFFTLREPA